jgi:hypothetical protein
MRERERETERRRVCQHITSHYTHTKILFFAFFLFLMLA